MSAAWAPRFWNKVDRKSADECWEWTGTRTRDGYGQFRLNGQMVGAHRASHLLATGSVVPGQPVDHKCRNRACVNPSHLRQVTHQTNTLMGHGPTAENASKLACPAGHPYDEYVVEKSGASRRGCSVCRKKHAAERTRRYRERKRELARLAP